MTKYLHNTQKMAKPPQGCLLPSYSSFVWLQLGKGVGEKKEPVWLLSSSTGGLHWCIGPVSTSITTCFSSNSQRLLEDLECSKNGYEPQSPACRICLCSQLDLYQSHCRPVLPLYSVPKIPHQAKLSWS